MKKTIELLAKLSKSEGLNATRLSGVYTYKASNNTPRGPLLYNQGIIIVGQGEKNVYLGNKSYTYNADNYLVLSLPLPLECEGFTSSGNPLLGLTIDIDISMLNQIINTMGDDINREKLNPKCKTPCLFTAKTDERFNNTVLRLLTALDDPIDAKVLGRDLVKELIYRIMCGENASSLYSLAIKNTNISKIEMALKEIHSNYQNSIDVDALASIVNMSVSSFHHTFKEATSSSPIQYLKKVRLSKAKTILIEEGLRVNEAARHVGYESATQFSREFKRYFGKSPKEFTHN